MSEHKHHSKARSRRFVEMHNVTARLLLTLQLLFATVAVGREPADGDNGGEETKSSSTSDPDVVTVLEAWRERLSTVKSVRLEWTERRIYAKGSIVPPEDTEGLGFPPKVEKTGVPQDDLVQQVENELLLDGAKMRYTSHNPAISETGEVSFKQYTSSYDGVSSRMLSSEGPGDSGLNEGRLLDDPQNTDSHAWPLMPMLMHLAPLKQRGVGTFEAAGWQIAARQVIVGDAACLHLENGIHHVWVDPERRYAILRWQLVYPDGRISLQADINHQPDPLLGSLPEKWKIDSFSADGKGRVEQSIEAELTDYQLDPKLGKNDFRVEFPANTHVVDEPNQNEFIIDKQGRAGPRVPIGQIQLGEPENQRSRYLLVVILAVCLIVGIPLWRYQRKKGR